MSTTFSPAGKTQERPESASQTERTAEMIPPMRSEFQGLCLQESGLEWSVWSVHEPHTPAQPQASDVRRRSETPGVGQHSLFRRTPGITGAVKVGFRQTKSVRHTASRACVGSPTTLGAGVGWFELRFIVALASRHVNNTQPRRENAVAPRIRPAGRTNCRDDSANAQREQG